MGNPLFSRVGEIDLSIEPSMVGQHRQRFLESLNLQERLDLSEKELESLIRSFAEQSDTGYGEKISVREYLQRNPDILQKYGERQVMRSYVMWPEVSRISYPSENTFCQQAREMYGGRFGEVLQIVFVRKNGCSSKYIALSGKSDGIDRTDIAESVPEADLVSLREQSELVVAVHNHPNLYRDVKVFENRTGSAEEFIYKGALSIKDIAGADWIYHLELKGKVPLVMIAINEDGLTHMYQAGTSGYL